jgi:hypothetical protein
MFLGVSILKVGGMFLGVSFLRPGDGLFPK